ncbi:cellulose binding domain-containing protein, partial [Acrocarpospora catenulata]|uniref:cellulose binding domain-containing protein n=1 Tax=Acrocarpospora catenulata TaxID=2836182 RepID=UPI001BDACA22
MRWIMAIFVLAATTVVATATSAAAAVACGVTYTTNDWSSGNNTGGFTASVTVRNLGDAWNGWTLRFTFPAGQTVTQGWSANWSQSGANVTATNQDYNAALGNGASTSIGFNGTWTGSNPKPSSFTVNGVTCTGSTPTATPTPTPSP